MTISHNLPEVLTCTNKKLVLVGNGMAGVRCIEEILQHNPDAFEITIFGSEPHVNYNRILLSTVLQGSTSVADIVINDRNWYEQNNIQLFSGETVAAIDTEKKVIKTDQDQQVPYDILILATGSVPFMLPLPGADKDGVIAFRTIEDCQTMVETAKQYKKSGCYWRRIIRAGGCERTVKPWNGCARCSHC
ncbi:hypothetical protein GCM10020331_071510 [Ectobacillus funiculus]